MLISEFLLENFRVFTRDSRANWLTHGVDELMDDMDGEKTILKQSPGGRYSDMPSLTVYPFIEPEMNEPFSIEIFPDRTARIRESYIGEATPVIQFLLSRWPAYEDIYVENMECTFGDIASNQRPRMRDQEFWYHGTTTAHLPSILRFGLMPRDPSQRNYRGLGGSQKGIVYLGSDELTARAHAENSAKQFGGAPVVLQIDLTGLESRIVDDHDVRVTTLGRSSPDAGDLTTRRVKANPGESSYLTIGTIGFRGRIPPTRIKVVWQGKERPAGRMQKKAPYFAFVNELGNLATQLSEGDLHDFFYMIGARIGGWSHGGVYYPKEFYEKPEQTVNSIFAGKSQPKQFARWVNGMRIRAAKWRRRELRGLNRPIQTKIVQLIDSMHNQLSSS